MNLSGGMKRMATTIGFVGTGVMGASIVKHLMNVGYVVHVTNRTKSRADEIVEMGAIWQDTPAEVAAESDVLFTMLGFPSDVENVYFGEENILSSLKKGSIVVDMTTSTPTLAEKIYKEAEKKGIYALDAPVSGGDAGARNGTLTVMVGGEKDVFESVEPIFNSFSASLECHGAAGKGQSTKMANQIMVAGTMVGLSEMLVYAKAADLDLEKVIKTVNGGAGQNWSLENYGPRILKDDFDPGFFIKHFIKDLKIALDEAKKLGIDLPGTRKAYDLYEQVSQLGYEDKGVQALVKLWWHH